eukprot:s12918_g1.t1
MNDRADRAAAECRARRSGGHGRAEWWRLREEAASWELRAMQATAAAGQALHDCTLALGFHCRYGLFLAMVLFLGPVGLSWAVLCFGSLLHLRLVAVDGSWLHLLRRLRALYGDLLRDDLDYLAWMARGFIYFVAFVLFTVIYYGMTWTTWRSLACASRRLLAFPAWLHLLRRLRGPCGALLHDGVGCSELDGWCSLTFSRFVGADAGPLRQSWRRFALGPLCLARVFNYLVVFVPLAVTYCETAWTASSSLAGASWCPLAFSAWLHQLRRLRDPGGALLHDGLGCFALVGRCSLALSCSVGADFGPLRLSRRWFALGPLRLAHGFIYLDAFVPLVVIYYGTAWTTSCSLACASWCPLALPAWLHHLWCLRGPCGALLHDGLGCSELFGWCSSAPSRLVDADDGPLRLSRRWFALGPLRLLPGGGGLKPRTSATLFFLGVEAWCFSFGGFGSLVLHLQSQVLLFHCRRLAGLLGQLVATPFWFWGSCLLLLRRL